MKFSINQSELQNALSVCVKGSSTRSTLSILAGVYLKAEEGSLTLQTTNLELSIKVTCPALVEEQGESVVPAKLFLALPQKYYGDTASKKMSGRKQICHS